MGKEAPQQPAAAAAVSDPSGPAQPRNARRRATERTPRLTARFTLYVSLAFLGIAALAVVLAGSWAVSRAREEAVDQARLVANAIVAPALRSKTEEGAARQATSATFDRTVRHSALSDGALRLKVHSAEGRIWYSTRRAEVGGPSERPDAVRQAMRRGSTTRIATIAVGDNTQKAIEAYVRTRTAGGVPVVVELYKDFAPAVRAERRKLAAYAAMFGLVLVALYVATLPILVRAGRRMREQVQAIQRHAYYDPLTGLPNRALFRDRVATAMAEPAARFAVAIVDLARFREVNDTLGHRAGDRLLNGIARTLRMEIPARDTVARLGEDEFGVLAHGVAGTDGAARLAARLREIVAEPQRVGDLDLEMQCSIGIALYPDHARDPETLVRCADIAVQASTSAGDLVVYHDTLDDYSPARLTLAAELRRAIAEDALTVLYQPQADIESGRIRSCEALVRWEHPELGLLTPDKFIPLAERTGIIRELTTYVIKRSLAQCREWQERGVDLGVAVNISGLDVLDIEFPDRVRALLDEAGIEPARLELEITENTVLDDPARARAVLDRLTEFGVRVAIDDFGSGNSSLGYLKRLPVEILKIDKSFVLGMNSDPDNGVIVRSTIDLGHNLGLRVVAEGVEDEAAWNTLAQLGCDIAQGYLLGKPSPPEVIERLVRERTATA